MAWKKLKLPLNQYSLHLGKKLSKLIHEFISCPKSTIPRFHCICDAIQHICRFLCQQQQQQQHLAHTPTKNPCINSSAWVCVRLCVKISRARDHIKPEINLVSFHSYTSTIFESHTSTSSHEMSGMKREHEMKNTHTRTHAYTYFIQICANCVFIGYY